MAFGCREQRAHFHFHSSHTLCTPAWESFICSRLIMPNQTRKKVLFHTLSHVSPAKLSFILSQVIIILPPKQTLAVKRKMNFSHSTHSTNRIMLNFLYFVQLAKRIGVESFFPNKWLKYREGSSWFVSRNEGGCLLYCWARRLSWRISKRVKVVSGYPSDPGSYQEGTEDFESYSTLFSWSFPHLPTAEATLHTNTY
jgi:hypothetical protein